MIRPSERWQVADTLSGNKAFPGDVRQRTDESVVVPIHERHGRDESSNRSPAAVHDFTSLVADDANRGGEHRSVGAVRRAVESVAAALASRFEVGDRKGSRLTCARWRRSRRSDVAGGVRPASGVGTTWLAVRATADSVVGKRAVLRAAHGTLVAVELQTSRRGVDELKH